MADQEQQEHQASSFDRWSRPPALSRRGYVLAVVVPLLVAAAGFGVVALVSSGGDTVSGVTVRLPVSSWAPSSAGGDTEPLVGTIGVDSDHCVYLTPSSRGGNEPDQVWAVWPAGYSAVLEGNRVTIYDGDDHPVAVDGDVVQMDVSTVPISTYATEPCLPDSGDVAVVQSDVTVQQ